ncbi:DNA-3-methyladenine glycosylase [Acidiferrimicrobium sp. IK]|uniref:DNA-3-methyladenine glycosylase n=1 Tax=Acidiferrimicrobium sp. IK TaxID=2871700 RepID=UPI0021CB4268|nr:DNA-3-methyladenine glycosylase [Acidiferrimicrobium sp. IK]MCU4184762.1 DNA-3-methyladenine glycosylase [Acidiferrimicrobium sp. IK]
MVAGRRLPRTWYRGDALDVAPALLNKVVVTAGGRAARIVEVEAYRGGDDPGSHAFRGRTPRNAAMFGPPGHLYVYFTYGMHWCANVVCAAPGVAQAVLLRAATPVAGVDAMLAGSPPPRARDLCRGPARLCRALGIGPAHLGADLVTGRLAPGAGGAGEGVWLVDDGVAPPPAPASGPRVGLRAGADRPWRFWVPGHPDVSVYRPAAVRRRGSAGT